MKKKFGLTLLALMLLCSMVLAACGGSAGKENTANTDSGNKPAEDETAGKLVDDPSKKVTITYYRISQGQKTIEELAEYKQFLLDKFNVDWVPVPLGTGAQYTQTVNTRFASGDIADIVMYQDALQYKTHAEQGYLLPLDDFLDDLKDVYKGLPDDLIQASRLSDGHVYGLPMRQLVATTVWIRQDWLDALNLSAPKTIDEFYEVAKAFALNDPDGNGKQDTFGVSGWGQGQDVYNGLGYVYGAFGIPELYAMHVEDGVARFGITSPRMKEALTFVNRLVQEKILDPEFFLNKVADTDQKAVQGITGIHQRQYAFEGQNHDKIVEINPNAKWVPLDPITGPYGSGTGLLRNAAYISLSAKLKDDPVKLARIIEMIKWFSTDEGILYANFGIEGKNFTLENGKVKPTDTPGGPLYYTLFLGQQAEWFKQSAMNAWGDHLEPLYDREQALLNQQPVSIYDAVVPPAGTADLFKFVNENLAAFAFGDRPLTEWDSFIQEAESKFNLRGIEEDITEQAKAIGLIQ
jgi:putative aldouronate transport system substrate-binding protein